MRAKAQKWTVMAATSGTVPSPSRHTLRRLAMKAKAMGLVSDWTTVRVLDSGDLMLTKGNDSNIGGEPVTVIAKRIGGNGVGGCGRLRWEFRTEGEYMTDSVVTEPTQAESETVAAGQE